MQQPQELPGLLVNPRNADSALLLLFGGVTLFGKKDSDKITEKP
jgi:hypothetical protein